MPAEEVYDEAMKTVEEELEELFGGPKAEAGPSRSYGADMLRAVQQVADDLAASVSAVLPPDVGQVVQENAVVFLLALAVACLALIYGASPSLHLIWGQLPDPSCPMLGCPSAQLLQVMHAAFQNSSARAGLLFQRSQHGRRWRRSPTQPVDSMGCLGMRSSSLNNSRDVAHCIIGVGLCASTSML